MKKSSYLSERVYDAIPSEINMESLEYWKKILKEEGLQYVKKNKKAYLSTKSYTNSRTIDREYDY